MRWTHTYVLTEGYIPSVGPVADLRTIVRRGCRLANPPGGSVGHPVANAKNALRYMSSRVSTSER